MPAGPESKKSKWLKVPKAAFLDAQANRLTQVPVEILIYGAG